MGAGITAGAGVGVGVCVGVVGSDGDGRARRCLEDCRSLKSLAGGLDRGSRSRLMVGGLGGEGVVNVGGVGLGGKVRLVGGRVGGERLRRISL